MNTQLPYNFERLLHLAANGDCSRVRAWMAAIDRHEPLRLDEDVRYMIDYYVLGLHCFVG
jgi:hypothetical protein